MIATADFGATFRRGVGSAVGKVCLACISVLATAPALLAAQAPGELRVTVIDKNTRRPVQQAALVVTPREEGDGERRQTDEAGAVRLEGLAPGLYAVRVDRTGYITALEARVRVSPRRTTSIEMEMIPGDARLEEVVVVASAA
ncbi:MAG: carboxypeptidase-like regulatory domain-containing protein, partial [Gammaproteobacteria bacterium]|nr:carboxypeptidase-like regulatory domain-containing protein [Gammaproteobacteria bacterium]